MTPLGIEPKTFQLVAPCLHQLCHCVPPNIMYFPQYHCQICSRIKRMSITITVHLYSSFQATVLSHVIFITLSAVTRAHTHTYTHKYCSPTSHSGHSVLHKAHKQQMHGVARKHPQRLVSGHQCPRMQGGKRSAADTNVHHSSKAQCSKSFTALRLFNLDNGHTN